VRTAIRAILACMLFAVAVSAAAQDSVRVQVPFDFQVNNQTFTAGTYNVQRANDLGRGILSIHGNGGQAVLMMTPASPEGHVPGFSFRHSGDSYWLSAITTASGRFVLPSARKARMAASPSGEVVVGSD